MPWPWQWTAVMFLFFFGGLEVSFLPYGAVQTYNCEQFSRTAVCFGSLCLGFLGFLKPYNFPLRCFWSRRWGVAGYPDHWDLAMFWRHLFLHVGIGSKFVGINVPNMAAGLRLWEMSSLMGMLRHSIRKETATMDIFCAETFLVEIFGGLYWNMGINTGEKDSV